MAATDRTQNVNFPELDVIRNALIPSNRDQSAVIRINVGKPYSGGSINVSTTIGGAGDGFFTTALYTDYSETQYKLASKRVTQKAIDKVRDEIVTDEFITLVKQKAIMHYVNSINAKVSKGELEYTDELSDGIKAASHAA